VFLSGEREIKDAADALSGHLKDRLTGPNRNDAVELLPLYSRLSAAEQHRIFAPHDRRRIVLATNVAETSLTVPGVRYVVDSGLARISRYSKSTKVQRLPIEPISRASARQRSGRSGREAAGVAIRLFSEDDFEGRDEFTEPEILRTSLAAVLLQMIAVGVVADPDEVTAFPFVQAPDTKAVRDGVVLLRELGALTNADVSRETPVGLTAVGRQLAALPIDPRLARMVLEGVKLGVGAEVVVIAAALSIQDPRERPQEERDFADQLHSRFVDPNSDFLTMLNLWNYLLEQQNTLSGSAFRRLCKAEFIHYLRVREWQDLVSQIRGMAGEIGLNIGHIDESAARGDARKGKTTPGDVDHVEFSLRPLHSNGDQIHRALLPGLLSQLGMQETRDIPASAVAGLRGEARARALRQAAKRARNEYLGARGTRFAIYPGSPISSKPPAWLMAGELVETSRLWARQVARINPDWIEGAADHLVRKSYANPHWSAKKGAAMATEKVMLYGLPIVTDRKVLYGKIDAPAAREMFIRHALIQNEWRTHHDFQKKNQQLLAEISQQVARSRRRDLITDEEDLFRFYDKRIPETVISGADFDYWWKSAKQKQPKLLTLTAQALAHPDVDLAGFPDTWTQGDLTLPLSYEMAPGTEADGVTLHIPVSVLARVENAGFDWLVPGMLEDLCVATIRSLPKPVRVQLVPAPDAAREIAAWLREHTPDWADMSRAGGMADSFGAAFAQAAAAVRGVAIPADTFDEAQAARLPAHLRMRFSVEAPGGKGGPQVLGASLDLPELQRELAPQVQTAVAGAMQKAIAGTMQTAVAGAIRTPFTGAPFIGAPQHDSARESKPENLTAQTKIPESVQVDQGGVMVRGYPALVAGKGSATLEILSTPEQVAAEHAKGVRALLAQQHRINTQRITSRWTAKQALTLAASAYPSTEALVSDLQLAAVGALTDGQFGHPDAGAIRSQAEFQAASKVVQANLENEVHLIVGHVVAALTAATELRKEIAANSNKLPLLATLSDIKAQLNDLLAPSFIVNTPPDRLPHLVRYLRAASHRIEKAAANPARDTELAWQIGELTKQYEQALAKAKTEHKRQDLELARWLLQELRVSYFAQHLGTIGTVSAKRFTKLLAG
ncbi:MAG: DUF3418 domain-containing protein, partial [Cellulomonadaceae bacterium]|jgi:ATP-dependent helicase HrpA|nr:DUF3418 domain-containing protein [Cellulomonadaceae bacterium]